MSDTRSIGWRQAFCSSLPRAATSCATTVGRIRAACCAPIRSVHSNALLTKSSAWPPSANGRSVAAVSIRSAISARSAPLASAVSSVRSAASRWRTSVHWRNQRRSVAGAAALPGNAARSRRGSWPAQSWATRRMPWNSARYASSSGSAGSRLASAVRIVMPMPKPSRIRAPNRAASPTRARSETPAARAPSTALAITRPRSCSMPSARRLRQCAAGSSRRRHSAATQTSPSSILTSAVGTSSAQRSKVPPLARSKRAWCQWQVRMPSLRLPLWSGKPRCGQRLSSARTWPSWWTTSSGQRRPLTTSRCFASSSASEATWMKPSLVSRMTEASRRGIAGVARLVSIRFVARPPAGLDVVLVEHVLGEAKRRGKRLDRLWQIVDLLVRSEPPPARCRRLRLSGEWNRLCECHNRADWLRIWDEAERTLTLSVPELTPTSSVEPGGWWRRRAV